ncbi:MAG: hypothetical protein KGI71_04075 [Patescibacteria group bacterium]|nr:hypothetical protein [Patescibacteria group bacterium]
MSGLVYLDDLLPEFKDTNAAARAAINDPSIGPAVRQLETQGTVHAGMLSCWEFVQL